MQLIIKPRRTGKTTAIINQVLDLEVIGARAYVITQDMFSRNNFKKLLVKQGCCADIVFSYQEFDRFDLLGIKIDYIFIDDIDRIEFGKLGSRSINYYSHKIIAYGTSIPKGLSRKLYENSG